MEYKFCILNYVWMYVLEYANVVCVFNAVIFNWPYIQLVVLLIVLSFVSNPLVSEWFRVQPDFVQHEGEVNSPAKSSAGLAAKLIEFSFQLIPHPLYSPELAPLDPICPLPEYEKNGWREGDFIQMRRWIAETNLFCRVWQIVLFEINHQTGAALDNGCKSKRRLCRKMKRVRREKLSSFQFCTDFSIHPRRFGF